MWEKLWKAVMRGGEGETGGAAAAATRNGCEMEMNDVRGIWKQLPHGVSQAQGCKSTALSTALTLAKAGGTTYTHRKSQSSLRRKPKGKTKVKRSPGPKETQLLLMRLHIGAFNQPASHMALPLVPPQDPLARIPTSRSRPD
ncbi:GM21420 [Drosophila sechellia]|uniref:GM21420 n=1 Tax=Drosophila sechellia TaxID=7238 RepID=B4IJU9_DROSE|nr:GM21420 [Drosophila sechellia]